MAKRIVKSAPKPPDSFTRRQSSEAIRKVINEPPRLINNILAPKIGELING